MSQEYVDRMREGIEAMNRRDIDAVLVGMHPEVRFEHRLAALQGRFVGVESVRGWFADLVETFDTWRISCEDIRDLGDRVVALGTIRATGRESGVETEFPLSILARYKDGLLIDFVDYGDRQQALEAAGLVEEAMSQANVERAHRAIDAFNRRDVAAFLELMDSEVETATDLASVEGHPYRGHSGVRDWWRDLLAVFPDFHAEILEARGHGDFVIALMRRSAHGLDSGTPIEETVWQASEWRNGRVLWWKVFATEAEALDAVGLSE